MKAYVLQNLFALLVNLDLLQLINYVVTSRSEFFFGIAALVIIECASLISETDRNRMRNRISARTPQTKHKGVVR